MKINNFISHRVNALEDLTKLDEGHGAEIDVRYHENELVLHHDPFNHHKSSPVKLYNFLALWSKSSNRGILILNIKTEGIEVECIDMLNSFSISKWFFLDLSMPYFIKFSKAASEHKFQGFSKENLAVRFSEHEPVEYALSFSNLASWVWVDYFTKTPLNAENYKILKDANFKLCIVSPELQGHSNFEINKLKDILKGFDIDAVCTKNSKYWS